MDDSDHADEPVRLPFRGPQHHPAFEATDGSVPLRLIVSPGWIPLTVSRSGTVLGRHTGADVRLLLPDISRQHCRFVFTGGHWQVIDLHSLNGVFLNDVRIQQAPLRHRDRLRIGNCTLEVDLLGEQVAAPKSASREDNTAAVLRQIVTSLLLPVPSRRAS